MRKIKGTIYIYIYIRKKKKPSYHEHVKRERQWNVKKHFTFVDKGIRVCSINLLLGIFTQYTDNCKFSKTLFLNNKISKK